MIENEVGRKIALKALDWHEDVHGPVFEYQAIRGEHGVPTGALVPREQPGKARKMGNKRDDAGKTIPAGGYTQQTLPTISKAAQQIVDAVNVHASTMQQSPPTSTSPTYLRIKRHPVSALRIKRR